MAIASIINTLHSSGPDIILYLIFHIPKQTESTHSQAHNGFNGPETKNPASIFGCAFFQGTDATVGQFGENEQLVFPFETEKNSTQISKRVPIQFN